MSGVLTAEAYIESLQAEGRIPDGIASDEGKQYLARILNEYAEKYAKAKIREAANTLKAFGLKTF